MKKIFSLVAIAAVAATMFTSCKDNDDPTPENPKAKLTLKVDKPAIEVTAKGAFTVTSDIAAPEAIVITVTSSDDKILTVDPASVTIAKDGKEISGTYTGVAEGKAKIKIATSTKNVSVTVAEVEVTVGTSPTPEGSKIAKMIIEKKDWGGITATYEDDDNVAFFNFWTNTYPPFTEAAPALSMDTGINSARGVKGMGTLVDGLINFAAQPKDATITFGTMVESDKYPVLWSPNYTANATGEDIYLAIACGDFDTTYDTYRVWIKLNLGKEGGMSNLDVIEAYICLDDSEFKVGQTK